MDPPVDFVANCAPTPFDQPRLLVEAMQSLVPTQPELAILPGDDIPLIRDRYLTHYELIERLAHYVDLCVMYGECFLRHENAQLSRDRDEILRKEMHEEILVSRISSNMDKLLGHVQRDNKCASYKLLSYLNQRKAQAENPEWSPQVKTSPMPRVDLGKKGEGPTCLSTPTPPPTPATGRHNTYNNIPQTGLLTEL